MGHTGGPRVLPGRPRAWQEGPERQISDWFLRIPDQQLPPAHTNFSDEAGRNVRSRIDGRKSE
jgi:hypothetical protein